MLTPEIMFAQMPTMIAKEHYNSIFIQTQAFQLIEHDANLSVDKADARIISVTSLTMEVYIRRIIYMSILKYLARALNLFRQIL